MTRDELEEQIRSVLSEKLSQEQITSIIESIQLDADRKVKLVVTSDPRSFGDTATNSTFFYSAGKNKFSGAEFTDITSTVSVIFGDIQPGYSVDINGDSTERKYEAPEFSMDQIQVVAEQLDFEDTYLKDSSEEEDYYRHDYVINIYIPDEKSLDSRKPRSETEARKIELLSDLKEGKKIQRRVGSRTEDVELTEELEEELNGYVQKVKERTPLVSYQELLMADAKLTLMERLALQTRGKISEENLAIIADRIVSARGPEFERHMSEACIEIGVSSDPDEFAEKVIESKIEYGYYGDRSGYHKDDGTSSSYTTPVYGDLEPGNYNYDYVVYSDSSSEENEERNLLDFSMNGLQVAIVDTIDDYASGTAIQIYIPEEREYEIVSYKEMKGKFDKEERTSFAKLVNQLMLKMEASLIVEGSEGYKNFTDFGRRITSEIMGTDEYFSNVGEFDESKINEDECVTIGMLKADYWEENGADKGLEDYLDIEFLGNGKVRLIVRNVDYDESRDDGDVEEEYYIASTVVSIEELQNFSDSLPGIYPRLPERMIAEGNFFDDNGRFSEDEVREFLKQKYIPGQFLDVQTGAGSDNYGEIHISIPNGMVTELTADMFEKYKENLVEVSIPFSVKGIEKGTFSNCPRLKKVVMFDIPGEKNPFELFENCPNLDSILIVPEEAKQYYKKGDNLHSELSIGTTFKPNENGGRDTTYYVLDGNSERKCKLIEHKKSGHDILEVAEVVSDRRPEDINGIISEILEDMQDKEKDDTSVQEV